MTKDVVDWLNANPEPSKYFQCAYCGGKDSATNPLLAILAKLGRNSGTTGSHTWVHRDCWQAWRNSRLARAYEALGDVEDPPF